MIDLSKLMLPFPLEAISWRAQSVTADGTKAMALAYIDARDVMKRLDDVCGVEGWQCEYPHANGKTICSIGIKCGDEWIWKADGAGDTDIEAEKGAISDAFKRAAVKWGIGRYLYDLDSPWVACESYKVGEKYKWKSFKEDPWKKIRTADKATFPTAKEQSSSWQKIRDEMIACETEDDLAGIWKHYQIELKIFERNDAEVFRQIEECKNTRKKEIQQEQMMKQQLKGVA